MVRYNIGVCLIFYILYFLINFKVFSFFSRAKAWLEACNRLDLLPKVAELHKYFRLCEDHFEKNFYSVGNIKKVLFSNAIPTLFSHLPKRRKVEEEPQEVGNIRKQEPLKKIVLLSGL